MNIEELKKYSFLRGLNLGQAEKDYYQTLVLFVLSNKISKELIFKGGTALAKCYGLNRFSEDLDFTATEKQDYINIVKTVLEEFNITHFIKIVEGIKNSKKYKIKIEGPLYKRSVKTFCSITLDLSFREHIIQKPNIITIGYHMDIIPAFDVYVLKEEEMFAEKIRAIMMRNSAKDLYDLVYLLNKKVKPKKEDINKKLEFINQKFDKRKFIEKCKSIEMIWDSELKYLVKFVPEFKQYLKIVKVWAEQM